MRSGCCFERRPQLLREPRSLLHFAPEWTMRERIAPIALDRGIRYLTADLDPTGVDLRLDLIDLALPDDAFDAVMCSHVLEHVPDDAAAMRELRRVTRPGGWCLVMVPARRHARRDLRGPERRHARSAPARVPPGRPRPPLRARHRRPPGRRGFAVETVRPEDLGADAVRRAGLLPADWIFLCR